jgi:hypothetical protein
VEHQWRGAAIAEWTPLDDTRLKPAHELNQLANKARGFLLAAEAVRD